MKAVQMKSIMKIKSKNRVPKLGVLLKLCGLCLAVFAVGCATTHPGEEAQAIGNKSIAGLKISAENLENKPKDSFQLIEVTLENNQDDWVRIHKINLVVGDPAVNKVSAVVGNDLRDWSQAMKFRLQKDQHNQALAQSGLLLGGAVLASNSKDGSAAQGLGALAMMGGAGWAVADAIQYDLARATTSEKVPENHLFRSVSIPGRMFTRKWLLINRPVNTTVANLVLEVETIDGKKDFYQVKF